MTNSRSKGKRGELEWAKFVREHGFDARRGQQFHGGAGSPDVVSTVPGVHFEVKRVEAGNLHTWMAQAEADAGIENIPVVAHRRNRSDWYVIMRADDFLNIMEKQNERR